ncbi:hypothetical protein Tco_1249056, partial [Tanacetum coccineum]
EGPYDFRMFTPSNIDEPKLQTEEDLRGDDLKYYEAKIKEMNLILISIPNDIYNSVDRETRFNNEFDQFVAEPKEALINQAIIQGDRVNIQSKNSGNDGRNTRRAYVQEEVIENSNCQNDAGNIQRTLRTTSSGTVANVQCLQLPAEKTFNARNVQSQDSGFQELHGIDAS